MSHTGWEVNVVFAGVLIPCYRTLPTRHRNDIPDLYNLTHVAHYCDFKAYDVVRYLKVEIEYWTQALLEGKKITNRRDFIWVTMSTLVEAILRKAKSKQGKQWKCDILNSIPVMDVSTKIEPRKAKGTKRKMNEFEELDEHKEIDAMMIDVDNNDEEQTISYIEDKDGRERNRLGKKTFVDRIEAANVNLHPSNVLTTANLLIKQKQYLVTQNQYVQICLDIEHIELILIPKKKNLVSKLQAELKKMDKDEDGKNSKKVPDGKFKSPFEKFETVVNRKVRELKRLQSQLQPKKESKQKLCKERLELLQTNATQIQQHGTQKDEEEEHDYKLRIGVLRSEETYVPNCGMVSYEKCQLLLDVFSKGCFECSQHGMFSPLLSRTMETRGVTLYIQI